MERSVTISRVYTLFITLLTPREKPERYGVALQTSATLSDPGVGVLGEHVLRPNFELILLRKSKRVEV